MKIGDIVLSKAVEEALLKKNGYISETILIKYPSSYDEDINDNDWHHMYFTIAYLEGKRPEWADNVPNIKDVKEFGYDYVLCKLVEEKISQILLD